MDATFPFDFSVKNNARRRSPVNLEEARRLARTFADATANERRLSVEYSSAKTEKTNAHRALIEAMASFNKSVLQFEDLSINLTKEKNDSMTIGEQKDNLREAGFSEQQIDVIIKAVRYSKLQKYVAHVVVDDTTSGSEDGEWTG